MNKHKQSTTTCVIHLRLTLASVESLYKSKLVFVCNNLLYRMVGRKSARKVKPTERFASTLRAIWYSTTAEIKGKQVKKQSKSKKVV